MFYDNLINSFNSNGIKYAIVGGVAVNLHGYVRMTADLDIILDMEDKNIAKAVTLLKEMGFKCKIPVDPIGLADAELRKDWIVNKNMKALNFYKRIQEVDFVIDSPVKYHEANKIIIEINNVNYPIVSKNDLIKMKTKSGRHQDMEDIRKLKILLNIEKENSNI